MTFLYNSCILFIGQYVRFSAAALITMFLGSQTVHLYFQPLSDMEKFINEEIQKLPEDQRNKLLMQ